MASFHQLHTISKLATIPRHSDASYSENHGNERTDRRDPDVAKSQMLTVGMNPAYSVRLTAAQLLAPSGVT